MNANVRDVPLKEFVDSHYRALDEDLAELRRSNEDESVPLILTETVLTAANFLILSFNTFLRCFA